MDLRLQEELFNRYWFDAYEYALTRLHESADGMRKLAFARYMENADEDKYFDCQNLDDLIVEVDEELADAIAWGVGLQWRQENERRESALSAKEL